MHPGFHEIAGPFSLLEIADHIDARLVREPDGARKIKGIKPLSIASDSDLAFFDNRRYGSQLRQTSAGACILAAKDIELAPKSVAVLEAAQPYESFAKAMRLFYIDAMWSKAAAARSSPHKL